MIALHEYLRNLPKLHTWDGGETWNTGGFEVRHLKAMHELVSRFFPEGAYIIETGAGNSTISFLISQPARLTTVCYDQSVLDRIENYCRANSIPTDSYEPKFGRSEWVLGDIARAERRYDVALIDGGHGWPTVFVDFFYMYYMLNPGGLLLLDDLQLHSIKELGRLIANERSKFALIQQIDKIAIFQKLTHDRYCGEWVEQCYVRDMTERVAADATRFNLSY